MAAIKIGVTQWSVDGRGAETVRRAAALGFQAVHIDAGKLDGELRLDNANLRDSYLQAARESDVTLSAISAGYLNDYGLSSPPGTPGARQSQEIIRIAVDAAEAMGVPLVFLPSFRAGEIKTETDLLHTAEALAAACAYAAGRPVALAVENTLGVEGNLRLLAAAGRPELQVLLDTQNPALWGHDIAAMVGALWPSLSDQVHVKDGHAGQMGNAVLGEGDSGYFETARALRAHDFAGIVISENDYLGERSVYAARDIAVIAQTLGE